ncbi:16257_t:CDS:2, partial [Cetraspora pellucida]
QDEVTSALDTLRSGPSTAKKQKTTNEPITQPLKRVNNNVENADVDGIDNDIQDSLRVITESPPRSPFSEMSTNILGNLHTNIEHVQSEKSETINSILEISKRLLTQNTSIMERQEALEVMVTQLINNIKTLQSSYQKLKIKENDCEWWQ